MHAQIIPTRIAEELGALAPTMKHIEATIPIIAPQFRKGYKERILTTRPIMPKTKVA
jgi:hypothetical protein